MLENATAVIINIDRKKYKVSCGKCRAKGICPCYVQPRSIHCTENLKELRRRGLRRRRKERRRRRMRLPFLFAAVFHIL